jgi:hypothetical protein
MAAIDLLPAGEKRLIVGAGFAGLGPPVVRCAGVDVDAFGAVTVAVAELRAAVAPV